MAKTILKWEIISYFFIFYGIKSNKQIEKPIGYVTMINNLAVL